MAWRLGMRNNKRLGGLVLFGMGGLIFIALLAVAGCSGGGGGPLVTGTAVTPVSQLLQLLPDAQRTATRVGAAKCGPCHSGDYTAWTQTKHSQVQVDCESCHGPGSVHT